MSEHLSEEANGQSSLTWVPSTSLLVVAALLNVLFSGLIQAGTLFQRRLVSDKGLTWPQAEIVLDVANAILTVGAFFVSAIGGPTWISASIGLLAQAGGLLVVCWSSDVARITIGYGAAALGGFTVYFATLRLSSAARAPLAAALMYTAFNGSAYTGYVLVIPGLRLEAILITQSALAALAALVVAGPLRKSLQMTGSGRFQFSCPGLRSPRYWALCCGFGGSSAGLGWAIGAFDFTVQNAVGEGSLCNWLQNLFPLVVNASFLTSPLFGLWAEKLGFLGPSIVTVMSTQLFLASIVWPSAWTLQAAIAISSLSQSSVYFSQSAYLLSFPREDFTTLLSGTVLVQGIVQVVGNFGPKDGSRTAMVWMAALCLCYIWPIMHSISMSCDVWRSTCLPSGSSMADVGSLRGLTCQESTADGRDSARLTESCAEAD